MKSEEIIEKTFKNLVEVEKKYTVLYDTVRVAKDVVELIEQEHARGNQVIVNVSGGRKPRRLGYFSERIQGMIWCRELCT